jgi:hypothetical protein
MGPSLAAGAAFLRGLPGEAATGGGATGVGSAFGAFFSSATLAGFTGFAGFAAFGTLAGLTAFAGFDFAFLLAAGFGDFFFTGVAGFFPLATLFAGFGLEMGFAFTAFAGFFATLTALLEPPDLEDLFFFTGMARNGDEGLREERVTLVPGMGPKKRGGVCVDFQILATTNLPTFQDRFSFKKRKRHRLPGFVVVQ